MKIAVLGSASSSVGKAPFKNDVYNQWVEGKVEGIMRAHDQIDGNFDIWACSPGAWAVIPRATRFFEVHRWEVGVTWFSPEYIQFLRDFNGIVYTGGPVPEIKNHVVYPLDRMEEKFSAYFLSSSLSLMMALAIDTIEQVRRARESHRERKWNDEQETRRIAAGEPEPQNTYQVVYHELPPGINPDELDKDDSDDVIGLWGVDMAAGDEYAYQRPGCQFFVLEAMRRGIGTYLPAESDLMRPLPVYGISEWDHNYIKLTSRAKELSSRSQAMQAQLNAAQLEIASLQGEQHALNYFVSTWTCPYGMMPGMVNRQTPGTGLGGGVTTYDGRPITRMGMGPPPEVMKAMTAPADFTFIHRDAAGNDSTQVHTKVDLDVLKRDLGKLPDG